MSKTGRYNYRRLEKGRNTPTRPKRRITVRGDQRTPPDLRKLGRAVIAMALADAEAEKASQAAEAAQANEATTSSDATTEEVNHDD
ncbi:hypothetical protein ACIBCN_19280 [Nocardia sp. NPDC051052]|uniref:hypothetical protein n=1 Tax=Nocardia sp. NPDC051052 TaxID=3364322 RepID=UPI00379A1119